MIELIKAEFAIDEVEVVKAKVRKAEKLNRWSTHIRTKVIET